MIAGIFDEFLGVPTHPLAVHAPVVLIPLLAVVSVVGLFRTSWRERLTVALMPLAFVMVVLLFAAKESGESLSRSTTNLFGTQEMLDRHQELGDQTFILTIGWFVLASAAAIFAIVDRRGAARTLSAGATSSNRDQVVLVLNALAAIALVVAAVWLFRTGHAGAEMRWPT